MGTINEYVATIKPEFVDAPTRTAIRALLAAIPNLQITWEGKAAFEFQATRQAFRVARTKLQKWCLVQREHFHHDDGGG